MTTKRLDDDVLSVVNQYTHKHINLTCENDKYDLEINIPPNYKKHYIELLKLTNKKIKTYLCPYHVLLWLDQKKLINKFNFNLGGTWYPKVLPWVFLYNKHTLNNNSDWSLHWNHKK